MNPAWWNAWHQPCMHVEGSPSHVEHVPAFVSLTHHPFHLLRRYVTNLLSTSFPNLRPQQVQVRAKRGGLGEAGGCVTSWVRLRGA